MISVIPYDLQKILHENFSKLMEYFSKLVDY